MSAILYAMLLAVVLLSGAIVLNSGGWIFVVVGIFVFPVLLIAHSFIHVQAIRKKPRVRVIVISHLVLLTAFLLRVDSGDASSFIALDVIAWRLGIDIRAPAWMGGPLGQVLDLFLFVLVTVSWLFVYPFSDPKLGGRIFVAILLPWWHFYTVGRRQDGIARHRFNRLTVDFQPGLHGFIVQFANPQPSCKLTGSFFLVEYNAPETTPLNVF